MADTLGIDAGSEFTARALPTDGSALETEGMKAGFATRVLPAETAMRDAAIVAGWEQLLGVSDNPERLYQSRPWIENLLPRVPSDTLKVAVVESAGSIRGVVPFRVQDVRLDFDAGGRKLARPAFRVANILGNRPLVPALQDAYDSLFAAIERQCPGVRGLHFTSLPMDSLLHGCLQGYTRGGWLLHPTDGVQLHHFIRLPETFEKFLEPLKSRTRRNFKRRLKGFDPAEKPGSRSERVDGANAVEAFLAAAATISRKTWQHQDIGQRIKTDAAEQARLSHLAEAGILRSYLLYYGETPCAFCIGYQLGDVYYADEVGFDPSLSDLSPGTVLFLKIIQDLLLHRRATLFNFGTGDASYKHLFSNETYLDATMLAVPATLRNRIVIGAHTRLQRLRERMKAKAKAASRDEEPD